MISTNIRVNTEVPYKNNLLLRKNNNLHRKMVFARGSFYKLFRKE